ncbi:hypothetical protein PQX77_021253 [Marasmius sp. AFHP31]|nr:hypothetical protein PQX77_021253 [Marasmius sp. AFHP31]
MNSFIVFIEKQHPFLALCDGHWKAHELIKNNYKMWRNMWSRRKLKEDREKAEKKEKEKGDRKRKKEKEEGEEEPLSPTDLDDSRLNIGPLWGNITAGSTYRNPKTAVSNFSSKKLGNAIVLGTIDIKKLAAKAAANLSAPNPPSTDSPAQVSSSSVVPTAVKRHSRCITKSNRKVKSSQHT